VLVFGKIRTYFKENC